MSVDRPAQEDQIVHRADTGRHYRGIPMHAADGLHEYAVALAQRLVPAGARAIDIGCGSGAFAQRLADAGYEVTATDIETSDYRADPPVLQWDVTDSATMPEARFGLVMALEVLEHVENPLAALRNLRTLLADDGVLVVSTPNLGHPRSRIKYLLRGAPGDFGTADYHVSGHRTLLPDWLLVCHLRAVGFSSINVSYAGTFHLTGPGRYPYAVLKALLTLVGWMPSPRVGDGAITVIATRA